MLHYKSLKYVHRMGVEVAAWLQLTFKETLNTKKYYI